MSNAHATIDRCAIEGWMSLESGKTLFENAGMNDYDFYEEARSREFEAFALNQKMSVGLTNAITRSKSHNVIAKYEGSERPDETIIYSAHWDHFGIGQPINGDSIYNGAVDNGAGVAAIIQVAQAFTQLKEKTRLELLGSIKMARVRPPMLSGPTSVHSMPKFPLRKLRARCTCWRAASTSFALVLPVC